MPIILFLTCFQFLRISNIQYSIISKKTRISELFGPTQLITTALFFHFFTIIPTLFDQFRTNQRFKRWQWIEQRGVYEKSLKIYLEIKRWKVTQDIKDQISSCQEDIIRKQVYYNGTLYVSLCTLVPVSEREKNIRKSKNNCFRILIRLGFFFFFLVAWDQMCC